MVFIVYPCRLYVASGIWVALALFATLTNFNLPDWAEVALIVVSAYLLFVGMVQQLIPARAGRS